jgi:hypothetical protein
MTIIRTGNVDGVYSGQEAKAPVTTSASNASSIPFTTLSVAHECRRCYLLVCEGCRDSVLSQQEADDALE